MRMVIILFIIVALLGLAWYFLTQAEIIPQFSINLFDKESITEWVNSKLRELSELIGYEAGAIYD